MRAYFLVDGVLQKTSDCDEVKRAHAMGHRMWVDLETRTPDVEQLLAETFELHPLTVEDIWNEQVSPKIEDFQEYLYVRIHGIRRGERDELNLLELDVVIGPSFVVTHDVDTCAVDAVHHELERSPRILAKGSAWVAHALMDYCIDRYLPIIDHYDETIDLLEDEVIAKAGTAKGGEVLERVFAMKRSLQALRRITVHQREVLMRLSRGDFSEIPPEAIPFYRDVFDHFVRVTDLTENHRELVSGALQVYLSVQSNRMNEVMKALTLISTIMLPLTFIAGIYGMNFDVMPELKWPLGYPFALVLMAAVALVILGWFKRKRWI